MATTIQQCLGNGECLDQSYGTKVYIKRNNVSCDYNCEPMKCPNYLVCGSFYPELYKDCWGGVCLTCDKTYGKWKGNLTLKFIDNVECPICMETRLSVTNPKCNHSLCIDCFRKCYLGDMNEDGKPVFPEEIEEEYYQNPDDEKWENNEVLRLYDNAIAIWEKERKEVREKKKYLSRCPLCRK